MSCHNAYKCVAIMYGYNYGMPKCIKMLCHNFWPHEETQVCALYVNRFLTKCHPSFRKQNIIYQKQDLKYF